MIIAMKHDIDNMALAAKDDERIREELIRQQESMILRTASFTSFRFVTKSDDEWSVALWAFSTAIDQYAPEKGKFLPFARLVMKRSLIDWHRSPASGRVGELCVSPFVLEGQIEDGAGETEKAAYLAVTQQSMAQPVSSPPQSPMASRTASSPLPNPMGNRMVSSRLPSLTPSKTLGLAILPRIPT